MSVLQFISSLVRSLAWPIAGVTIVIVLRRPIAAALARGVRRLKAGPLEVEFEKELVEIREDLARVPELTRAPKTAGAFPTGLADELSRVAELSPRAAIMEAFARVEQCLRKLLTAAGVSEPTTQGGGRLARLAHEHKLISDESLRAVEGLAVLRNLAAHSPEDELDTSKALDYLALADAVMFALRDRT